MNLNPTAPECIVEGCTHLSALTDVTTGELWNYSADYCSDCYTSLLQGVHLRIDASRLELTPAASIAAGATSRSRPTAVPTG